MIKEIINFAGAYRLKAIKSMPTRNGLAWTATIYKDGKKIGSAEEDGRGGMLRIFLSRADAEALHQYAVTKVDPAFEPSGTFLSALCDYTEAINKLKRTAKKKIVVLNEKELDEYGVPTGYGTFPHPPTAQNIAAVKSKRPDYRLFVDEISLWA